MFWFYLEFNRTAYHTLPYFLFYILLLFTPKINIPTAPIFPTTTPQIPHQLLIPPKLIILLKIKTLLHNPQISYNTTNPINLLNLPIQLSFQLSNLLLIIFL